MPSPSEAIKTKFRANQNEAAQAASEVAQGIAQDLQNAYASNQANINSVATSWMNEDSKQAIAWGCDASQVNAAVAQGW